MQRKDSKNLRIWLPNEPNLMIQFIKGAGAPGLLSEIEINMSLLIGYESEAHVHLTT